MMDEVSPVFAEVSPATQAEKVKTSANTRSIKVIFFISVFSLPFHPIVFPFMKAVSGRAWSLAVGPFPSDILFMMSDPHLGILPVKLYIL
jgi:hypothetical protein